MDYEEAQNYLKKIGQEQLLRYYDELTDSQKAELIRDVARTDFSVLKNLTGKRAQGVLSPAPTLSAKEIAARREEFEREGLRALDCGEVAAVLLAGGQGTRLGSDKPKGAFNMGITRNLSIFGCQFMNIAEVTRRTGKFFEIFVMTSALNDGDTRKFFVENDYFGYPAEKIHFFVQSEAPVCDRDGKVLLSEKHRVALAPNGNGGWFSSLKAASLTDIIEERGIKWLNVYSVDNVLQKICDPVFCGATILSGAKCGAKVVKKVSADEKVGVLCNEDGKPSIVEYFEMPEAEKYAKNPDGSLKFGYGVTLNYLFDVRTLFALADRNLPYHVAIKAVPHIEDGKKVTPSEPDCLKFETLVVDMIPAFGSCIACEVERDREFAPVKNAKGADSVEVARKLLIKNGVKL